MSELHKYTFYIEGDSWDDIHELVTQIDDKSAYHTTEDDEGEHKVNAWITKVVHEEKID